MTSTVADWVVRGGDTLAEVRYENRGKLAHSAPVLEKRGCGILSANIGNPGRCGSGRPETVRLATIENLGTAEPYNHQKDIFPPALEAVATQRQDRGILNVMGDDECIICDVIERTLSLPERFV